jgi:hypothetical protein
LGHDGASSLLKRGCAENPTFPRTQSVTYQAHVHVDDPDGLLRLGLRGRAKVHCAPQTLASRAWRFLSDTFNFRL